MRRGKSYYGGKGYYIVRFSPGEKLLYSQFSGGKGYYGGKATIQHRTVITEQRVDEPVLTYLLHITGTMASASDIPVHFPVPTPCSLCEEEVDVNSFCKECHQYLCDRCKRLHGKSPFLKNHHLVPYTEGFIISKNYSVFCDDHNEVFSFFCRTCNKYICNKCLASRSHRNHDYTDTNTYSEEVTDRIQKRIDDEIAKTDEMEK